MGTGTDTDTDTDILSIYLFVPIRYSWHQPVCSLQGKTKLIMRTREAWVHPSGSGASSSGTCLKRLLRRAAEVATRVHT